MRIDDPPVTTPPPRPVAAVLTWLTDLYWNARFVLEDDEPLTVREIAFFSVVGLLFGFLFIAFSTHLLMFLMVAALGCTWGMFLGLLGERVGSADSW